MRTTAVLTALATAAVVAPLTVMAVPDAPGAGRTESCVTDSTGSCNVPHGFGEKPTAVLVTPSGSAGFAAAVVNPANTTASQYRVTFYKHDGTRWASTTVSFTTHYDFDGPPPPDTTAPDTTITSSPPATTESEDAAFLFTSTEAGSTFECQFEDGPFETCEPPAEYSVSEGEHHFAVRAKDAAGNTDATPAEHTWNRTAPPPAVAQPSWAATGDRALTFSDEFEDTAVDPAKWEKGWFKEGLSDNVNGTNDNCYHSDQVSESGGYLHLVAVPQANTCKGVSRPYTSGMVTTRNKFTQREGSYEARMCLSDLDGNGLVDNWPAAWANGMASGFQDGEIDLVEGIGGGRTKTSVHYNQANGTLFRGGQYTASPLIGCHNFGAEYAGSTVTFYIDGVEHWSHEFLTVSTAQLTLILNQAVDDSVSPTVVPAGGNDLKVDWIRAWAPAAS